MKFAILGSGNVGQTIASGLLKKGHEVILGSRSKDNEKAKAWLASNGGNSSVDTFADAAKQGEVIFLCLNGDKAIEALQLAGPENFKGKIVIDLTNPLDFSRGFPPSLLAQYRERSLGEAIQDLLSDAHVVKTLNTITAGLMVNPALVNGGDHDIVLCGNDQAAKQATKDLLSSTFGWRTENMHDLGDITAARATEAYVIFWAHLMKAQGTPMFNIKLVR